MLDAVIVSDLIWVPPTAVIVNWSVYCGGPCAEPGA